MTTNMGEFEGDCIGPLSATPHIRNLSIRKVKTTCPLVFVHLMFHLAFFRFDEVVLREVQ